MIYPFNSTPIPTLGEVGGKGLSLIKMTHADLPVPHLIDSRGRIGQTKKPTGDPNVLSGLGISRGVARGRVKVLHTPREKPILKGDVLVAYTTDPGWTPLFVNAEAIILEVGGMLQHGGAGDEIGEEE